MRYRRRKGTLGGPADGTKRLSWRSPVSSTHASPFRSRLPLYISLVTHGLVAALFVSVGMRIKPTLVAHADEYQIAMLEVAGGSTLAKSPLLMAPNGDRKAKKEQPESRASVH